MLIRSENFAKPSNAAANPATAFAMTDIKLYVLVLTLSCQDSTKLLQQLKPGFKRPINPNNY